MLRVNGKRIIPAPFISFSKTVGSVGDSRPISSTYNLVLNGTLLPNHGSPVSTGGFFTSVTGYPASESLSTASQKFDSIIAKQEALKELFSQPGLFFEYGADDNLSTSVSGRIRLSNINFEPGSWTDKCAYTINLEADLLNRLTTSTGEDVFQFNGYNLIQASDSLQISESDDGSPLINVSQNISAVGKTTFTSTGVFTNNKEGWENAKDWCVSQLNSQFATQILQVTGLYRYNLKQIENIDRLAGSYSITRNYSVASGNPTYIHTYDVQKSISRSHIDDIDHGQSLLENITINGNVVGLLQNSSSATGRIAIARSAYNTIEPSIPSLAGLGDGFAFTNKNVLENYAQGSISYSHSYTNFPTGSEYSHTLAVNTNNAYNAQNQISVNGSVKYNSVSGVATGMFANAKSYFVNSILPNIKTKVESVAGYTVMGEPINLGVVYNYAEGRVDYSAGYIGIDAYNSGSQNYLDQFEVSLNDQGNTFSSSPMLSNLASVSVGGTILGLSATGTSSDRYTRASTAWNTIKADLKNRAAIAIGSATGLADRLLSRSESHNKVNGSISYNYTFTTRTDLTTTGIIGEEINIEKALPRQVFAEQIIPGTNATPILQNLNTWTSNRITITVDFLLEKNTPTSVAEDRFTTISGLYAPTGTIFRDNNTISNNIYTGRYSRSASWTYR